MSERSLHILVATLLLLLVGGAVALSYYEVIGPAVSAVSSAPDCGKRPDAPPCKTRGAAGPDCRRSPDSPACLIEEARDAVRQVEHPLARTNLTARIVQALLTQPPSPAANRQGGELVRHSGPFLDQAIEAATGVADIHERIMSILPLAVVLTEAGHEHGPGLFESLVRLVEEEGPGNSPAAMMLGPESAKSEMLLRIAQARAVAGDADGARKTVATQSTGLWRVKTHAAVAGALVRSGKPAAAADFADAAAAALKTLPDPDALDEVAAEVAGALAGAGRITEALALAAEPADVSVRSFAHMNIAKALADAGLVAEAEEAFSRIESSRARGQALWSIARAKARSGDFAGAAALLAEIDMPLARNQAVADVAGFQAAAGDLQGALDRIADLPPDFYRGRGLRIVVESLIDAGRLAQAEEVLAGLGDDMLRHGLTVKMAGARAGAGETEAALAMARAAQDPRTRAEALLAVVEAMRGPD